MRIGTNIEQRDGNGFFYYRRVVPDDLQKKSARRGIRLSLRTKIRAEAVKLARQINVQVDRLFAAIRSETVDVSVISHFTTEVQASLKRWLFDEHVADFEDYRDGLGRISPEEAEAQAEAAETMAKACASEIALGGEGPSGTWAREKISKLGIEIEPGSAAERTALRLGRIVRYQTLLAEARRYRGDYDDTQSYQALKIVPTAVSTPTVAVPKAAFRPLSEILTECKAHQVSHKVWTPGTAGGKEVSVRFFKEIVGDIPFAKIAAEDAAKFDRALQKLPRMIGWGIYAGLTAPQASARLEEKLLKITDDLAAGKISEAEAARLRSEPIAQAMQDFTRNKHINSLASLFTWANKVMNWNLVDPFKPFQMTRKARRKIAKKRAALKRERAQEILCSPRFSGRSSAKARGQTKSGDIVVKDGLYWSVLIEAHQGARLDEAAKLLTGDIRQLAGIWCMRFNHDCTEAGSGKTEGSKRTIPMHDVLIKLGLPAQAARLEAAYEEAGTLAQERWLFPELTRAKHQGTFSANLTKRWGNYLRTAGLYKRWEDGHAFRHTFNTMLQKASVPTVVIKELLGHARHDLSEGTYYSESNLQERKAAIDKLDYGLPLVCRDGEWQIAPLAASPID